MATNSDSRGSMCVYEYIFGQRRSNPVFPVGPDTRYENEPNPRIQAYKKDGSVFLFGLFCRLYRARSC